MFNLETRKAGVEERERGLGIDNTSFSRNFGQILSAIFKIKKRQKKQQQQNQNRQTNTQPCSSTSGSYTCQASVLLNNVLRPTISFFLEAGLRPSVDLFCVYAISHFSILLIFSTMSCYLGPNDYKFVPDPPQAL